MAPVVHGLAKQYEGRVDFLYLDVADPRNAVAKEKLAFTATSHFFFLRPDGTKMGEIQGVVPRDSVVAVLERLRAAGSQ